MLTRRMASLIVAVPVSLAPLCSAADTLDGYVTNIASASEFSIGHSQIECDAKTRWKHSASLPDALATPRVGMLVHVVGGIRKGAFVAKSVQIDSGRRKADARLEGKGLIGLPPSLHHAVAGWFGTIWIEGYPVSVNPETKLAAADGSDFPADKIATNQWASFQGFRSDNGSVVAERITFEANLVDAEEKDFRDKAEPEMIAADPGKHTPAKLRFGARMPVSWELLPDREMQEYVTRVGDSLVPQYQKELPDSDPTKIHFRFYVVKRSSVWTGMDDAIDLPNGVVLVRPIVLASLANEAQLATHLSYSIAHVLEKQDYRYHSRLHRDMYLQLAGVAGVYGKAASLPFEVDRNKLQAEIDERCDRVGLSYMLQRRYDIREAAFAYTMPADPPVHNPLIEGESAPERMVRLMESLQYDYATTDYASLYTNGDPYDAIREKAHAASK